MPFSSDQMRAIAARMRREGKSQAEIREFFHKHGHPGKSGRGGGRALMQAHGKHKKGHR